MRFLFLLLAMLLSENTFSQEIQYNYFPSSYYLPTDSGYATRIEFPSVEMEVDVPPQFPGGEEALLAFIRANKRYPEIAIELLLEGTSVYQLIIDEDGSILDVFRRKGAKDCPYCDIEAYRILCKMPHWIPAQKEGKAVRSYAVLSIEFNLNEVKRSGNEYQRTVK